MQDICIYYTSPQFIIQLTCKTPELLVCNYEERGNIVNPDQSAFKNQTDLDPY